VAHRGEVDEVAADELLLYLDNEYDIYRQKQVVAESLLRKIRRGTYDHRRAPDAWDYVVEMAAKKYAREFPSSPRFNVPTRALVAEELADRWYRNAKAGRPEEV